MVVIYDEYIPDREVGMYFIASDLVVLPYECYQSGIVQNCLRIRQPVVVTSVGGLPEVVADGGPAYVVPPKNARRWPNQWCDFFELNKGEEFSAAIDRDQDRFS